MGIFSKSCLGIDIGASSIKIVEISSFAKRKKLKNYVEFTIPSETPALKTFQGESLTLSSDRASEILEALLKEAKIKEKKSAFSLPDFSTFFTSFSLPPMSREEVPQAIEFEARHYIPVPLSEVTFDWQIIEKKEIFPGVELKVLLVAVPNKVLASYQRAANLIQIELKSMEAEVFGLIRSSIPKALAKEPICLVDIGWQSTSVSIVEKEILRLSHSFDVSSQSLTRSLSKELSVDLKEAEELKTKYGLDPKRKDIAQILLSQIDSLVFEIEKICRNYYQKEGRNVNHVIIAGGTATLFGLRDYLESKMKKKIILADPFSSISFPASLKERLKELGPSFAVAVGVALMGLES